VMTGFLELVTLKGRFFAFEGKLIGFDGSL
jgi:hypothetical protein